MKEEYKDKITGVVSDIIDEMFKEATLYNYEDEYKYMKYLLEYALDRINDAFDSNKSAQEYYKENGYGINAGICAGISDALISLKTELCFEKYIDDYLNKDI